MLHGATTRKKIGARSLWLTNFTLAFFLIAAFSCASDTPVSPAPPSAVHPSKYEEHISLSLRALALEAQKSPMRPEVATLAGIGQLDGFVVEQDNADVILIGWRSETWPALHLDDLAVNIRNIWNDEPQPYCSLDPRQEDVLKINRLTSEAGPMTHVGDMDRFFARLEKAQGPQTVVVGGVPKNSRHAHVMIDADYHMKKLSQGLVRVDAIPSCINLVMNAAEESIRTKGDVPALGMSMSRFWFHIGKDEPTFQQNESENIVCLDRCSVVVLTEKQRAAADGSLYDSGGDDPHAQAFARELSDHYHEAAAQVREYADLENIFRLSVLLKAMHKQNAASKAGLDLAFFLEGYACQMETPMPSSMPGLANSKKAQGTLTKGATMYEYVLFPIVCGGVSMETPITSRQFSNNNSTRLDQLYQAVIRSRPSRDALCWSLPKSAGLWGQD